MPELSPRAKQILIVLGVLIFLAVIGLVIWYFLKGNTSSADNITVDLTLYGPNNRKNTWSTVYQQSNLKNQSINDFIGSVIVSSKIITQKFTNISWNNIAVNTKILPIDKGHISDTIAKLNLFSFFGNSIPQKVSVSATYTAVCLDNEKPLCDPCKGQIAVCNNGNWVCQDNQRCPSSEELVACCLNNSAGPFPTCKNNIVSCGPCPEDKKPDCGEPTCYGFGPLCTATGWICAKFQQCPTDLSSCCPTGLFASCQQQGNQHVVSCAPCDDSNPPKCDPDCDMSGLVCGADGKKHCQKGVSCPPADILKTCCSENKFPVCSSTSTKVQCIDCPDPKPTSDPNYQKCQNGSCLGHGWVCTNNGWVCLPNQVKPPENFDYSQCCPHSDGPNVPYSHVSSTMEPRLDQLPSLFLMAPKSPLPSLAPTLKILLSSPPDPELQTSLKPNANMFPPKISPLPTSPLPWTAPTVWVIQPVPMAAVPAPAWTNSKRRYSISSPTSRPLLPTPATLVQPVAFELAFQYSA
jgi:hypothetical protein